MSSVNNIPVFKCSMCGSCCRMSPISILPHEEVILRKLAEYMEINVVFTNGYTVYEAVNGVNIAFSYIMHLDESGKCPFQKGVLCSIHGVYKPYICRSFPYIPRHVKYHIDDENKYMMATTDYGLSTACPVVKKDRPLLEEAEALHGGPVEKILIHYYKDGYWTAIEMDNARALMLDLLSRLWQTGVIDIKPANKPGITVNLYEFLRRYYPDLPQRLGVDLVYRKVKTWLQTYYS